MMRLFFFFLVFLLGLRAALDPRNCPQTLSDINPEHWKLLKEVALERKFLPFEDGGGIDPQAKIALEAMQKKAAQEKVFLEVGSSYRSYSKQIETFFAAKNVTHPIQNCFTGEKNRSIAKAQYLKRAEISAPIGFSQHHTGKAFDFLPISAAFEKTAAFEWLQKNAATYGFELSYPKNSPAGGDYEPWHWYFNPKN